MLSREWRELGQHTGPWPPTSETRFVTGNPKYDAQLHYVLTEFGVEVEVCRNHGMKDYRVVDEQKFDHWGIVEGNNALFWFSVEADYIMFLLRWT